MTTPTFTSASSLQLDARRLGMLEAMGISYWWPTHAPTPVRAPASHNVIALPTTPKPSPAPHIPNHEAKVNTTKIVAAGAGKQSDGQVIHLQNRPKKPLQPSPTPSVPHAPAVVSWGPRPQPETWNWDELAEGVQNCRACGLCQHRRQAVLGVGSRQAKWLIVGEGPGEEEDKQGVPFVGPAGQLLNAMLLAMGLDRERDVYIANAVKCRPKDNRNPSPYEWQQCQPYLMRQIELVQPELILAMGRYAAHTLLDHLLPDTATWPLGRLRGRVHESAGRPVVVTYHPAYLLRSPSEKGKVWQDLCLAMSQLHHNPLALPAAAAAPLP